MKSDNKPLHIAIDVSPLLGQRTGIAFYIERLLVSLAETFPDDIRITAFYYNFLGRRPAGHLPQAANICYRPIRLLPSKIMYQLRRWRIEPPVELYIRGRADFALYPNFLGYPSLTGIPSSPVIHDLTYLDLPQYVSPKLRRDLEHFVPEAIRRAAFTTTVSDFSKQRIHDVYKIAPDDILVTHIPPPPIPPIPAARRQAILQEQGITKPFVLFVGTIDPRKNIISLIEAYTRLPAAIRQSHQLVLVGRIERFAQAEEARLRQAIDEGHDIIHLGYVDDETKNTLLQSAALFTTASRYEGFGMPILEAMSQGLPCAVSDIPVFREIASDAAAYFPAENPAKTARIIGGLLNDPVQLKRLSKAGAVHVASYRWDHIAADLYDRILTAVRRTAN